MAIRIFNAKTLGLAGDRVRCAAFLGTGAIFPGGGDIFDSEPVFSARGRSFWAARITRRAGRAILARGALWKCPGNPRDRGSTPYPTFPRASRLRGSAATAPHWLRCNPGARGGLPAQRSIASGVAKEFL